MNRRRSKPQHIPFTESLRAAFRLPDASWKSPQTVQVVQAGHQRVRLVARFQTPSGVATARLTVARVGGDELEVVGEGLSFRWVLRR